MAFLAISTEYRHVTDRWTDGQTDISQQHNPCYAQHHTVINTPHNILTPVIIHLINVVKTVIHKPSDQWRLANCKKTSESDTRQLIHVCTWLFLWITTRFAVLDTANCADSSVVWEIQFCCYIHRYYLHLGGGHAMRSVCLSLSVCLSVCTLAQKYGFRWNFYQR